MKDGDRKRMEKKKDYRNVEDAKKVIAEKFQRKMPEKIKTKEGKSGEIFLKDERGQLCQSIGEDDVKSTLLKFGLVTHLFEDISKFRQSLKALQDSVPRPKSKMRKKKAGAVSVSRADKEIIQQKGGPSVKLSQSNWVGRSLELLSPLRAIAGYSPYGWDDGSNGVEVGGAGGRGRRALAEQAGRTRREAVKRDRKGTVRVPVGQVPVCYGWKYLKAVDGLVEDKAVDTEYLGQAVSDMLDMRFGLAVASIIDECGAAAGGAGGGCPSALPGGAPAGACGSECGPGGAGKCGYGERCCLAGCGGYRCSPAPAVKAGQCAAADRFMQCVYQQIDRQLCAEE